MPSGTYWVSLTRDQQRRLRALIAENEDLFIARDEDCSRTTLVQHNIDTGNAWPIQIPPYFLIGEFQSAQTIIFAIEEINNRTDLLPGICLGYKIYDTCGSIPLAIRAALALMNGNEETLSNTSCSRPTAVQAIIGESASTPTIAMSAGVGPFRIPVISHFATCACLSNRRRFPSFFRTIPSDYYQSRALAQLVKHFGWTWVGTIRVDNDYGHNGMATFVEAAEKEGICIEYSEVVHQSHSRERILKNVEVIKKSTSKVIVAFLEQGDVIVLIKELSLQNVTGLQWIGSEAWITASDVSTAEGYEVLTGSMGFAVTKNKIDGFREFLLNVHPSKSPGNALLNEFWETAFNCTLKNNDNAKKLCTGLEDLGELKNGYATTSEARIFNNVYKAVYAVAYSLHNLLQCKKGPSANSCDNSIQIEPWQVLEQLKKVNFTTKTGENIFFDGNGDSTARYDLVNWQLVNGSTIQFMTIGYYDASLPAGHQIVMNQVKMVWTGGQLEKPESMCSESCLPGTRKAVQRGRPVCCYDCIQCAEGEISNTTDSNDCIQCPLDYWSNENRDECVIKIIEFLSFEEIMGILLMIFSLAGAFLTICIALVFLKYKDSPIVKANNSELSRDGFIGTPDRENRPPGLVLEQRMAICLGLIQTVVYTLQNSAV
nr:PREDICTED: extracellular calcium-sensing receptor-like [Lepisosteus oculatus]